jgi:predicted nucleic acid-binding protein
MSFVVDTDICSAHLRDNAAVTKRFIQYTGGLYISTVTLAELYAWVYRVPDSMKRFEALDRLLSDVHLILLDEQVAERYGRVRAELSGRGIGISTTDLLIGASALHHDFTVVTHNVKHFEPIPGLRVQDWLA